MAAGFTEQLFLALAPPFPLIKLLRFDGYKTNNIIHVKLFGIINWVNMISKHGSNKQKTWFVDEGTKLPFFLQLWQHKHRIIAEQNNTVIVEDISYTTPFILLDYLLYPLLWLQFAYRIPVYKQYKW